MDIVERLRRYRPTYGWPEERSVIVEPTMNHVAADEIERLRKALQLIAAPSKVVVKGEEAVVALRLVLSSHRRTARQALGENE